ncbi:hypothetical protein BCR33DRAFT_717339 [Rhizoclosmatium globosum]|uniref:Uncharacterized protein n=1 Tax=Rhizoclosmatium globosum TaxID=329046 RepID=A0A1Y2C9E5_9FUNG|nr:hypothetical protein BCR33DRAFT_717339 [Rhizoclosmatium globosum]|eukprot:ORY43649.1 hypothetical protein BCR33DRAFT_717339 [Rhizoclosmatium globosum]
MLSWVLVGFVAIGCVYVQATEFRDTCEYKIILKITSQFETNSIDLNFESCAALRDSQGISAGFIQFTTCSGNVQLVCQEYMALPSSFDFCKKFALPLAAASKNPACNMNSFVLMPDGLQDFCQIDIQYQHYFLPATALFQTYGLTTPLAKGQLFDANVQLGVIAVPSLAAAATQVAGGSPATGIDEMKWLSAFLDQRDIYVRNLGGEYALTTYRVISYKSMMNNPWFKDGKVTMTRDGVPIYISC